MMEGQGPNDKGGSFETAETEVFLYDECKGKKCLNEEDTKAELKKLLLVPKDTFSFFAFVEFGSQSFVLAFLVLLVQVLTLAFLMADGIDLDDSKNPLDIPASVTWEVLACQFLALLIAVLSQTDLVEALNLFYNGYKVSPKKIYSIEDREYFNTVLDFAEAVDPQQPASGTPALNAPTQHDEECQNVSTNNEEGKDPPETSAVLDKAKGEAKKEVGGQSQHSVKDLLDKTKELPKRFVDWLHTPPAQTERTYSSSPTKWFSSVILRFCEGALCLTVTFILVVREETARDVLLNFTAVEFVSSIDDLCFGLAKMGYFGRNIREDTDHDIFDDDNAQVKTPIGRKCVPERFRTIPFHFVMMFIIFIGLISGWTTVVIKQHNGDYISDAVFLQFSDEYLPALGTYSGVYRRSNRRKAYRMMYEQALSGDTRSADRHSDHAWLGYCATEDQHSGFWSLTIDGNPCSWLARSSDSESFEILESATSQWYVKDNARIVPIQYFTMVPFPGEEPCGGNGSLRNGVCECKDGWLGLECGFNDTCTHLSLDIRKGEFFTGRKWASDFSLYRDKDGKVVEVYDRPVFFNNTNAGRDKKRAEIIMFVGRRWVLFESVQDDLDLYLKGFRANFTKSFKVAFMSEAVDVGSPSDAMAPLNLEWFHSATRTASDFRLPAVDSTSSIDAVLLCSVCHDITNPCKNNGTCVEGACKCPEAAKGSICEKPPLGNGRCDVYLNTPEFGFDGGDCCESTCVSQEYTCGKDDTGYVDHGYFFCRDEKKKWRPNSSPIPSVDTLSKSGSSVALAENGAILAVGDPGADTVRLFDKFGSKWVQRAQFVGPQGLDFGRFVTVRLTGPSNMVSRPSALAAVQVAASGSGIVRVYSCTTKGCTKIGNDIEFSGAGNSLSLWRDRYSLLVAVSSAYGDASVFRSHRDNSTWVPLNQTDLGRVSSEYVSFSRDGKTLAVGGTTTKLDYNINMTTNKFLEVEVYRLAENELDWNLLGDKVKAGSFFNYNFPNADYPSESVALSGNSMVLAIGGVFSSSPGVQVFVWNETKKAWTERGAVIVGVDDGDVAGWSVDVSFDGLIVAVGTGIGTADGKKSPIRVFRWNGTNHEQLWNDIPGGEASAISLSDDGSALAVGLPFSEGNRGGNTIVYNVLSPTDCGNFSSLFRLSITADDRPHEISWDLRRNGEILFEGDFGYGEELKFATLVEEECLAMDECSIFTIFDINGIKPPGGYNIFINGSEHASGGNFSSFERIYIGNCSCDEEQERFRVDFKSPAGVHWSIDDVASGQTIMRGYENNTQSPFVAIEEACVNASDCLQLSFIKIGNNKRTEYEVSFGEDAPVFSGYLFENDTARHNLTTCSDVPPPVLTECDAGKVPVRIEVTQKVKVVAEDGSIRFHDYRAPWFLLSHNSSQGSEVTGTVLLRSAPGDPTKFNRTVVEQVCVTTEECLQFSFGYERYPSNHTDVGNQTDFGTDTPGDYRLFYDEEDITAWDEKPQYFGNCTNMTLPSLVP